jgi:hypothetical protein
MFKPTVTINTTTQRTFSALKCCLLGNLGFGDQTEGQSTTLVNPFRFQLIASEPIVNWRWRVCSGNVQLVVDDHSRSFDTSERRAAARGMSGMQPALPGIRLSQTCSPAIRRRHIGARSATPGGLGLDDADQVAPGIPELSEGDQAGNLRDRHRHLGPEGDSLIQVLLEVGDCDVDHDAAGALRPADAPANSVMIGTAGRR